MEWLTVIIKLNFAHRLISYIINFMKLVIKHKCLVCAAAAELGDYCADEHQEGYLNEFHFVPDQSDDLLQQVAVMHKKHR